MNYNFAVNNNTWGSGIAEQLQTVREKNTGIVRIPLQLNFLEMGMSIYNLLTNNQPLDYQLSAQLDVGTTLAILKWLSRKYPIQQQQIEIGSENIVYFKITDGDAVIEQSITNQQCDVYASPYWAELWPSAIALAEFVYAQKKLPNTSVLEIGCGMGLPGIVAGLCGANVTFNDREDDALRLAELNFLVNTAHQPSLLSFDWSAPPNLSFPLILAADVVYETAQYQPLLKIFNHMLAPGGEIWLAEPNRPIATPFFELLTQNNFRLVKLDYQVSMHNKPTNIAIYQIRKVR